MMASLDRDSCLSAGRPANVSRGGRARFLMLLGVLSCAAPVRQETPPAQTTVLRRDYARLEREVLVALNRARTTPAAMAANLESLLTYYDGSLFQRPGQAVPIRTVEGAPAVREAVAAVRHQAPLNALALSEELSRAARDQAQDQQRSGGVGHTGSDGSSVTMRVARYGTWQKSLSENIDYSEVSSGDEIIQNLLIDDGVSDRGHRRNIFDPSARVAGIACRPHPRYTTACVIVQAGGFIPK